MFSKLKNKKRGFTLVEILVIILIIGCLFIFLVPKVNSVTDKARESAVKTRFNEFRTATSMMLKEHAGFSKIMLDDNDVAGFVRALNENLDPAVQFDSTTIEGQYCNNNSKDPWNEEYRLYLNVNEEENDGYVTFISYGSTGNKVSAASSLLDENGNYTMTISYEDGVITYDEASGNIGDGSGSSNSGSDSGSGDSGNENTGSGEEPTGRPGDKIGIDYGSYSFSDSDCACLMYTEWLYPGDGHGYNYTAFIGNVDGSGNNKNGILVYVDPSIEDYVLEWDGMLQCGPMEIVDGVLVSYHANMDDLVGQG